MCKILVAVTTSIFKAIIWRLFLYLIPMFKTLEKTILSSPVIFPLVSELILLTVNTLQRSELDEGLP